MSTNNFKRDIEAALSSSGLKLSNNLLGKFASLNKDYRFSAKQLAETWKDFSRTHKTSELNDSNFSLFRDVVLEYSSSQRSGAAVVGREGLGRRSVSSSHDVTPFENTSNSNVAVDTAAGLSAVDMVMSKPSISSPMRQSDEDPAKKSVSIKNSDRAPNSNASSAVVTPGKIETPTPANATGTHSTMTSFLTYEDRKNKGQVIASYNPQNLSIPTMSTMKLTKRRCTIQEYESDAQSTKTSSVFRYMFCPNSRRAEVLEKKWQSLRRVILSHLQTQHQEDVSKESQQHDADFIDMTEEEIPVGIPQSSPHVTIGRICNEAHSGTLNAASMVLEGSKSRSNGARIHLDVSNLLSPPSDGTKKGLDGWSFFPGQMVALQGRNVTGRKMIVDQVVAEGAPPPPICKTMASQLMDYHHGMDHQNGSPLRVVVACGPFTTQDDLSYQPLGDLLYEVARMNENEGGVDLVILMGPFVDVRQPLLMDGNKVVLEVDDGYDGRESKRQKMHVPYETLFANKVAGELFTLFEQQPHLPTQFVLVPSIDDAVAEPTYPQPPLIDITGGKAIIKLPGSDGIELGSLGLQDAEEVGRETISRKKGFLQRRIHCVPNPCTLKMNEVTIGVSSLDTLLHLSSEETNGNLEPGTRLTRLASHFIRQRSYYPLFPPPSSVGMEVNLDLTRSDSLELPCQPDLFIVPSKLTTFCKCIFDKTVLINPGHLVKGSTGGSYADILIHPMKRETLEAIMDTEDVELAHDVQERIRVDIKKI